MQEDAQVWDIQAGIKIQREDRGDTKTHTLVLFPKTMLGDRNDDIESLLQDTGYGGRIVTVTLKSKSESRSAILFLY